VSEGESTPASVPSTPKSDNKKSAAEEPQKKTASMKKAASVANNVEESKIVESKEKTAVFDELGGLLHQQKKL